VGLIPSDNNLAAKESESSVEVKVSLYVLICS
jgi:hypothetical protein